jgi:hypothetical protein
MFHGYLSAIAALFLAQVLLVAAFRLVGVTTSPSHKLYYVAADLLKAATLVALIIQPEFWQAAVSAVWHWDWTTYEPAIRWMAIVYCATDVAQFPLVKMQRSTLAHHACTGLFGVYIAWGGEFTPVCKAMLWYGLCSVVAYLVNGYKALRVVVDPRHPLMETTRTLARTMYALELLVNWPVHTVLVASTFRTWSLSGLCTAIAYLGVTIVFVLDDIKLYRFLASAPGATGLPPLFRTPRPAYPFEYRPPTPPRTRTHESMI